MISGKIQIQKYSKIHKGTKNVRNPHILRTLPILHFFGVLKNFKDIKWFGCYLKRFVTLRRWSNDIRKNRNSKNTKKFTRVQRMWGCLTLFVPSQFSTSLDFLKFFGASYGLDVVWIGLLHLEGGQMIFGKINMQKY